MKTIYVILLVIMNFLVFSNELSKNNLSLNNLSTIDTRFIPRWIKSYSVKRDIIDGVTDEADRGKILDYYIDDGINYNWILKPSKDNKADLIILYNLLLKYPTTRAILTLEKEKTLYENQNPVFLQKGGMLFGGDHSFYFRTDDEWTGFSTVFLGYRFGVNEFFNIGFEGGVGLPQIYLVNLILHFKLFETDNKVFFLGLRARIGYNYQNTEQFMFVGDMGYMGLGVDYYNIKDRHGFYFATDLTAAVRFGRYKSQAFYYTIFPKVDFDLRTGKAKVLFSPVMAGYEVRWGIKMEWSFAVETGYAFPIPWGSIPDGEWINFPSLANVSVNYRFGGPSDRFYSKSNQKKIYDKAQADTW